MKPAAALGLLACLAVAGCTSQPARVPPNPNSSSPTAPPFGAIEGTAQPCFGIQTPPSGYQALVALKRDGAVVKSVQVGSPFEFRFDVPPGAYTVVGVNDPVVQVQVSAGSVTHVRLDPTTCD